MKLKLNNRAHKVSIETEKPKLHFLKVFQLKLCHTLDIRRWQGHGILRRRQSFLRIAYLAL